MAPTDGFFTNFQNFFVFDTSIHNTFIWGGPLKDLKTWPFFDPVLPTSRSYVSKLNDIRQTEQENSQSEPFRSHLGAKELKVSTKTLFLHHLTGKDHLYQFEWYLSNRTEKEPFGDFSEPFWSHYRAKKWKVSTKTLFLHHLTGKDHLYQIWMISKQQNRKRAILSLFGAISEPFWSRKMEN